MTVFAGGARILEVLGVFLEGVVGSKFGRFDTLAVVADELLGRVDMIGLEGVDGDDQRPKFLSENGDAFLVGWLAEGR